mgnify:FL=1
MAKTGIQKVRPSPLAPFLTDPLPPAELFKSLALPPDTPLDHPHLFLEALALRLAAMRKGGEPDTDFAGRYLIRAFREGKLGRWTLDGLGRGGEAVDSEMENVEGVAAKPDGPPSYLSSFVPSTPGEAEPEFRSQEAVDARTTEAVDQVIGDYFAQSTSIEAVSGHQAKKLAKAAQAQVRDVKRKARAVVQVQGTGIASARRRKYRRNAS